MRMTRFMGDEVRILRGGLFSSRCCFFSRYRVAEFKSLFRWFREEREFRELEFRFSRFSGFKFIGKSCVMVVRLGRAFYRFRGNLLVFKMKVSRVSSFMSFLCGSGVLMVRSFLFLLFVKIACFRFVRGE